jgi:RecG-like helicase
MRPASLNPLFVESASLKGVGPNFARPLERLGLTRVRDFLYHLPDRFVQRRAVADLDDASVGEQIVVALTPIEYRSSQGRGPFRVFASGQRLRHRLFRAKHRLGAQAAAAGREALDRRAARPVRTDAADRASRPCVGRECGSARPTV